MVTYNRTTSKPIKSYKYNWHILQINSAFCNVSDNKLTIAFKGNRKYSRDHWCFSILRPQRSQLLK